MLSLRKKKPEEKTTWHSVTISEGRSEIAVRGDGPTYKGRNSFDGTLTEARQFWCEMGDAINAASRLEGAVASLYPNK